MRKQFFQQLMMSLDLYWKTLKGTDALAVRLFGGSLLYIRGLLVRLLSIGSMPKHIAFILDGNRRYAKKHNTDRGTGYRAGFLAIMSMLQYCYEFGVEYTTIYAFSIDNFKRRPEEVQLLMDLLLEKIQELLHDKSMVNQYGVRVHFVGNLKLLREPVRVAAEEVMKATANNTKITLLVCLAYSSTDEIVHAVQASCQEKWNEIQQVNANKAQNVDMTKQMPEQNDVIKLVDIERHMDMSLAPDPDILIRTSGATRLSNFLLWQTTDCVLYSPKTLFPEIGLPHLIWAVLKFQRQYPHLQKRKKQL
ncbi:dehydrodolichyl diphosphate synthase CPT3 [Capsicum galapagoense]